MRIKLPVQAPNQLIWLEGGLLVLAASFLLFPAIYPVATLAVLLLLLVGWSMVWIRTGKPWAATPFNGAVLFFLISVLIGILITADMDLSFPKATGIVLGLSGWRYCALYVRSRKVLQWALSATLGVFCLITTMGIFSAEWSFEIPLVQLVFKILPTQLVQLPGAPVAGVSRNQLAGTVVSFLPLFFSLALGGTKRSSRTWRHLVFLLVAGSLTGLLVATQSRSAWFGAGLGLGSLWVLWIGILPPSRTRHWLIGGLFLGLLAASVLVLTIGPATFIQVWQDPPEMTLLGDLSSLDFRKEVWRWALMAVQDFPFTGCGLGTFRRVVRRFYPLAVQPDYDIAHAHNIFLQTALDIGLPGLIAYLALLMMALVVGWRVAGCDISLRPWALGILAGLIAQHGFGLADALSLGSKPGSVFWMFLGVLTAMQLILQQEAEGKDSRCAEQDTGSQTIQLSRQRMRSTNTGSSKGGFL